MQGVKTYYQSKAGTILVGSENKWWKKSYIGDYISIAILAIAGGLIALLVPPYHRYLPPNDLTVRFPERPDIIPAWLLIIFALVLPILVFVVFQFHHKSKHDLHHAVLGLLASFCLALFVTSALKSLAGRYRPDYWYNPNKNYDSRSSFPSGHSSTSFSGLGFLSCYFSGKLHIFSRHTGGTLPRALLAFSPITISFFIAVSRTMDYHHNFDDIIAGGLLGAICAFFCYFLYYPSLFHVDSHLPKLATVTLRETEADSVGANQPLTPPSP
ncbi:hypothetical protein PROFUN_02074 [Planoprotostelium fungivorum]|uniref:Phosphatidic acid phosphatase type 2/haloperoxidase domain-containing protein n=1 Tax=Planoprotostelium fungivorum TaxID=1890364 RepID=A0A2P6NBA8_9EUKA|nr:hypothetical protein PROFUN_02074 [Planoprotostelium fungivorum]